MNLKYILKEANYYRKMTGLSRAIKKFLLTQTPLSKIVNSGFYNKIYLKSIKNKVKTLHPKILQIETTNFCNARCVMCPHVVMKRGRRVMNEKNFEKILDNVVKSYKIERLVLSGFGEPFIDKGLIDKIRYSNKKYPNLAIDIYTNASLLTIKKTEELLQTKISRITLSVNATKKKYKKIMGLNYNITKNNILHFLKEKNEKKHPVLVNISLMVLDENKEDVEEFIEFWSPKTDSVRVYAPSDWAGGIKNIIQMTPFKNKKRWPCFALWNNITVDVEGNVIMCCRDYESKKILGNLLKKDIKEIRNSKEFKELLKKQLNFDFKTPVCVTCDNSLDSSIDWIV
jgi:radical SAM protein with 4Fe4S-binding SPASM domain